MGHDLGDHAHAIRQSGHFNVAHGGGGGGHGGWGLSGRCSSFLGYNLGDRLCEWPLRHGRRQANACPLSSAPCVLAIEGRCSPVERQFQYKEDRNIMPCTLAVSTTGNEDFTGATGAAFTLDMIGPAGSGLVIVSMSYNGTNVTAARLSLSTLLVARTIFSSTLKRWCQAPGYRWLRPVVARPSRYSKTSISLPPIPARVTKSRALMPKRRRIHEKVNSGPVPVCVEHLGPQTAIEHYLAAYPDFAKLKSMPKNTRPADVVSAISLRKLLPTARNFAFPAYIMDTRFSRSAALAVLAQQQVANSQMNKMLTGNSGNSGSTSLLSNAVAADILSLATEYGAVTQTNSGNTTTLRANALGITGLLAGNPYLGCTSLAVGDCTEESRILRGFSASLSVDTPGGSGTSAVNGTNAPRERRPQQTFSPAVTE